MSFEGSIQCRCLSMFGYSCVFNLLKQVFCRLPPLMALVLVQLVYADFKPIDKLKFSMSLVWRFSRDPADLSF